MQVVQHTGAAARDVPMPKDHTSKSDVAKHMEVGGRCIPNKEGHGVRQAEIGMTNTGSGKEEDYAALRASRQPEDGGNFPPMDPVVMTPIIQMICDAVRLDVPLQQ